MQAACGPAFYVLIRLNPCLMRQRREVHAQIIRPDYRRQDALPERELQESDGEEPSRDPDAAREEMLFDFYILHMLYDIGSQPAIQ